MEIVVLFIVSVSARCIPEISGFILVYLESALIGLKQFFFRRDRWIPSLKAKQYQKASQVRKICNNLKCA